MDTAGEYEALNDSRVLGDEVGVVPFVMEDNPGGGHQPTTCMCSRLSSDCGRSRTQTQVQSIWTGVGKEIVQTGKEQTTTYNFHSDKAESFESANASTFLEKLQNAWMAAAAGMPVLECCMLLVLSSGNTRELRTVEEDLLHISGTNTIRTIRRSFDVEESDFALTAGARPSGKSAAGEVLAPALPGEHSCPSIHNTERPPRRHCSSGGAVNRSKNHRAGNIGWTSTKSHSMSTSVADSAPCSSQSRILLPLRRPSWVSLASAILLLVVRRAGFKGHRRHLDLRRLRVSWATVQWRRLSVLDASNLSRRGLRLIRLRVACDTVQCR
jgi:hypothetical protein